MKKQLRPTATLGCILATVLITIGLTAHEAVAADRMVLAENFTYQT